MKCQRCFNETSITQMSMLNTQECCMDCIETEKERPDYQRARDEESRQVQSGNYNFKGIGE